MSYKLVRAPVFLTSSAVSTSKVRLHDVHMLDLHGTTTLLMALMALCLVRDFTQSLPFLWQADMSCVIYLAVVQTMWQCNI